MLSDFLGRFKLIRECVLIQYIGNESMRVLEWKLIFNLSGKAID